MTRLDGAWGYKFGVPMFEPEVFRKQSTVLKKVLIGVGWPDDRHGLSPILYDTAPVFIYTDQPLCHCVFICSNFR